MAMARTKTGQTSRRCRATPARLRPHCHAIRKDLDPGLYPTIEALKAAIANGTFNRAAGAQNQAEVEAMNKEMTPVDEVRAIRHRIAEECGHDVRKIMEHAANAMRAMKLVATPSFG